jgi:ATP-binding cassette subfamily B protein RaxB
LSDILLATPEPAAASARAVPAREGAAAVELRGVNFRHGDAEGEVLHDISVRIEPGESVAIVGPSGCGKTTLVKLMLGILQPQSGEVLVGGVPLRAEGLAAWRAQVGAVMQDEPLFAGTIADNIAFFDPQPDLAWVERCASVAGVHDEITAMPMAYQTLVGEAGASLSGGQKQRVLLARALYKRPSVLVLDEATSALDIEGERRMNQAVRALSMTRIIVAHRPETVASADRVIGLRQGRVVQDLRAVRGKAPAA